MTNYNSRLLTQYPPYIHIKRQNTMQIIIKESECCKSGRRHRFSKAFVIQSYLGSHLIDDHLMT